MTWFGSSECSSEGFRGAARRELIRRMPLFLGSLFVAEAALMSIAHVRQGSWQRYALCVTAGLASMCMIFTVAWAFSRKLDEFERRMMSQAAVWAVGALLTITTVWGFLAEFAGTPPLPTHFLFVIFFLFLGVANRILRVRNRSHVE